MTRSHRYFLVMVFLFASAALICAAPLYAGPGSESPRLYRGDLTGDGAIGLADGVTAMQLLAGIPAEEEVSITALVGRDGRLGLSEAVYIMQVLAQIREPIAGGRAPPLSSEYLSRLSTDQKALFAMFGAPDHFIIIFDRNGHEPYLRIETWGYGNVDFNYSFAGGNYSGGQRFSFVDTVQDAYSFTPMHFSGDMSYQDIADMVGFEPRLLKDRGYHRLYGYGNSVLTFIFDARERLVGVVRKPEERRQP